MQLTSPVSLHFRAKPVIWIDSSIGLKKDNPVRVAHWHRNTPNQMRNWTLHAIALASTITAATTSNSRARVKKLPQQSSTGPSPAHHPLVTVPNGGLQDRLSLSQTLQRAMTVRLAVDSVIFGPFSDPFEQLRRSTPGPLLLLAACTAPAVWQHPRSPEGKVSMMKTRTMLQIRENASHHIKLKGRNHPVLRVSLG